MQFNNKVILITGGATGIGAATAKLFASLSAKVYVLDEKPLTYQAENVTLIKCNVANFTAVEKSVKKIMENEKKIDALIINAGIHLMATIEESTLEEIDRVLDVNINGAIYLLKTVLPIMKMQNLGDIIFMGSDQSFIGKQSNAIYGLTKGAIGQLTKSTAIEYAPYNIRANCICPGTIETPMMEKALSIVAEKTQESKETVYKKFAEAQPAKRVGQPEEIAKTIVFICSREAAFMTGALIAIDGGYTAQ